jgi:dienelactone hydrolase
LIQQNARPDDERAVSGIDDRTGHARRALRATRIWLALFLAAAICFSAWPVVRQHLQAIAVLRLVGGQQIPWALRKLTMEPVRSEEIHFSTPDGMVRARLYLPVNHPNAPGMVVLHGVHYLGMDEPRLMNFAAAMAGCGLRVLTPELPGIKDYHVDAGSVRVIGDSAEWFRQQTGAPVGVLGLSFSGGLALVASSEPAYEKNFKFVFAVGSDDSMAHVEDFYLTGEEMRPDGSVQRLKPHDYGTLVLEYEHLDDFVAARDEASIRPVLQEHLYEDAQAEKAAFAQLTLQQHAKVMQLFDAESPVTKAELAADEKEHLEEMSEVSPHGKMASLMIPVYLLHGESDNIIPSAETLWMASELPKTTLKAELISPVLSHLDFNSTPTAGDQWRLVHFFANVLCAAENKESR